MGGSSSHSIGWISSSPLGQQVSAGMRQQWQQNTGKGRAVALGLVLGGSVADWERCRCLGALARGSPVYPRCRSGTPGTCLGGVYRSTAGASLPHCVQKWAPRGHGGVCSAWYWWKPSCLCGWLCGVGVLPGPLLPDSPPLWMPVVSGFLLSVLSIPVLAGPAKGPFVPFRCWGSL